MKRHVALWIIGAILFACGAKKETQTPTQNNTSKTSTPVFSSTKLGIAFPSQLSQETLKQAQIFESEKMDSVVLISLLPECEVFDKEERCSETTVLSTLEGDSLKREHLKNFNQIEIDRTRFGSHQSVKLKDIQKLLTALFTGDQKETISFCYVPRHAIAIYGPDSRLSGFIEVCFECSESIAILESVQIPDLSQQALNSIGELFLSYDFDENKLIVE